jgi:DNA-binding beta-propeller fold protein YncE
MAVTGRILSSAAGVALLASVAGAQQGPRFTVDMLWPKPLPQHELLGSAVGVAVDAQDHVFVVHKIDSFTGRTETGADADPPIGECCKSAKPVLEFDAAGKLVNAWGGPGNGYEWPAVPAGVSIDPKGNVWITGAGPMDGQVLVFTHDGKFVRQIGKAGQAAGAGRGRGAADTAYQGVSPGGRGRGAAGGGGRGGRGGRGAAPALPPNSTSMEMFGGATRVAFSADGNTAYVADGERNRRVVEVDANTGAIKKFWGAYGKAPSDAPTPAYSPTGEASQQFSGVACVETSKDGMLYVCDRMNDRIQVFKLDGTFVSEAKVAPATLGEGSVWDVALSRDAAQAYLYVADGASDKIRVLDRKTMKEITNFGDGGRVPGTFYAVHSIATDSKGNLFTAETYEGKRVQKFTYGGVGAVKATQGVLWPGGAR